MRRVLPIGLAGLLGLVSLLGLAGSPASAEPAGAAAGRAVCRVCQVKEGSAEEEPVRAVRTHEGREYGFCSEKCAREFASDPPAYLPPVLPRPAPDFGLQDLSGKRHTPEALRGRVVLIDFWATWCGPCRKSMPELQALHQRLSGERFTVLGVSIDEGGAGKVKRYIASKRISYPIALDDPQAPAWEAFRVKAVPAAFLLDREGRIVAQWTGRSPDAAELERKVRELLAAD